MPVKLYEQARQFLLVNEPLLAWSDQGGVTPQGLSAGEIEALHSVGLSTSNWAGSQATDPLTRSIAGYMALLETSYTTSEAARYLKVDVSRIRQRLRERSLFGVEYDGERRLPRFQFERHHVLPGLRDVISALPAALNPLDVAEWFLSPNPDLEVAAMDKQLSPRNWLLRGEPVAAVVALARGFE